MQIYKKLSQLQWTKVKLKTLEPEISTIQKFKEQFWTKFNQILKEEAIRRQLQQKNENENQWQQLESKTSEILVILTLCCKLTSTFQNSLKKCLNLKLTMIKKTINKSLLFISKLFLLEWFEVIKNLSIRLRCLTTWQILLEMWLKFLMGTKKMCMNSIFNLLKVWMKL